MTKHDVLKSVSFGQRVAEDETKDLSSYFVETDQWTRLFRGDIDVIYGPKGSGKSALYALLNSKRDALFDRNILLVAAENPQGAPAFRNLLSDPPVSEREFTGLWKLYFATLLQGVLDEFQIKSPAAKQLEKTLQREGLIRGTLSLAGILASIISYVRSALRPQSVEAGLEIDPISQLPKGFNGKITFNEPTKAGVDSDLRSVDNLLELANSALASAGVNAWVLLDRLDVAFSENIALEANALRALFRVYLDLLAYPQIQLKIFLRSDIWARITTEGFREASHVTRALTIEWNRNSLLNLVVRRAAHNASIREFYGTNPDVGRSLVAEQETFFDQIFPNQVDVGPNKPTTLDWFLSRTRDGTKTNAPRELIHLLNTLRDVQIRRFEVGDEPEPEGLQMFARAAFKVALPEVSKVRLEQTLFAEHPDQKSLLEKLKGEKTLQTPDTLAQIWGMPPEEAIIRASTLATIGFFEQRGTKQSPEYWVPFLYREALDLVQGSAE